MGAAVQHGHACQHKTQALTHLSATTACCFCFRAEVVAFFTACTWHVIIVACAQGQEEGRHKMASVSGAWMGRGGWGGVCAEGA
jgi:hypothetical protein